MGTDKISSTMRTCFLLFFIASAALAEQVAEQSDPEETVYVEALPEGVDVHDPPTEEELLARNLGGGVGLNFGPVGLGLAAGLGPNGLRLGGGAGFGSHYQSYGTPLGYKRFYQPRPVYAFGRNLPAEEAVEQSNQEEPVYVEALPEGVDVHNPPTEEELLERNLGGGFGVNFGPVGLGLAAGLGPNGLQLGGGAGFGSHYQSYGTPIGYKQFYQSRPVYSYGRNLGGGFGLNFGPVGLGLAAGLGPNGLQLGGGAGFGSHYQSYGTPVGYKQFYQQRPVYSYGRNLGGGFGLNFGPVGLGLAAGLGPNGLQLGGGAGFGSHYQSYGTPVGYKQFYQQRPVYSYGRNLGGGFGLNFGPVGLGLAAGLGPNGLRLGGGAGFGSHYQSYGTPIGYKQYYQTPYRY